VSLPTCLAWPRSITDDAEAGVLMLVGVETAVILAAAAPRAWRRMAQALAEDPHLSERRPVIENGSDQLPPARSHAEDVEAPALDDEELFLGRLRDAEDLTAAAEHLREPAVNPPSCALRQVLKDVSRDRRVAHGPVAPSGSACTGATTSLSQGRT
jgi:hypothetical protein